MESDRKVCLKVQCTIRNGALRLFTYQRSKVSFWKGQSSTLACQNTYMHIIRSFSTLISLKVGNHAVYVKKRVYSITDLLKHASKVKDHH